MVGQSAPNIVLLKTYWLISSAMCGAKGAYRRVNVQTVTYMVYRTDFHPAFPECKIYFWLFQGNSRRIRAKRSFEGLSIQC